MKSSFISMIATGGRRRNTVSSEGGWVVSNGIIFATPNEPQPFSVIDNTIVGVANSSSGNMTGFYPNTAPIDLSLSGGSLLFPDFNNDSSIIGIAGDKFKASLYQDIGGGFTFSSSATPQASFAIVRLDRGKRFYTDTPGIFGNSGSGGRRWWMRFNGADSGVSTSKNKFEFYQFGHTNSAINMLSSAWTEDSALVVAMCDGLNNWQLDWYSLKDGTRYPGSVVVAVTGTSQPTATSNNINIGRCGTRTVYTTSGSGLDWPGEIQVVGYAVGANTTNTTIWRDIALGANAVPLLGASNIKFYRQFDGTPYSYSKNSEITGDKTPAATMPVTGVSPILNSWLRPGSNFRRQTPNSFLTIDNIPDGMVYGLVKGQNTKTVSFSGQVGGFTGNIDILVFDLDTGQVVKDWTTCGSITGNTWSANLILPKTILRNGGIEGWWGVLARPTEMPSFTAKRMNAFGVGWKIMCIGQSQFGVSLKCGSAPELNITAPMGGAYLTDNSSETSNIGPFEKLSVLQSYVRLPFSGKGARQAFIEQMWKYDPNVPILVTDECSNGTSMWEIFSDRVSSSRTRNWIQVKDKLDNYGNDYSVLLHLWYTNDGSLSTNDFWATLDALYLGTGKFAEAHSMLPSMQPGCTVGVIPGSRGSGSGDPAVDDCVTWAYNNNFKVGIAASDAKIPASGGGHPTDGTIMGGPNVLVAAAIAAARALDLDTTTQNPTCNSVVRSIDSTKLIVSFNLPNGGTLYSPNPNDVRSFAAQDGGTGSYTTTGILCQIGANNTLEITKVGGGTWLPGTKVKQYVNLQTRADGDGAAETAIINGAIYETWNKDVRNRGLLIVGSSATGKWRYADWVGTAS